LGDRWAVRDLGPRSALEAFEEVHMPLDHTPGPFAPPTTTSKKPRVLVVDDDPELLSVLADDLERFDVEVITAMSGLEMLHLFEAVRAKHCAPFDVVITDVRMPGGSGLDGIAELRRHDWSTPVMVMSGQLDLANTDDALRLGAEVLLDKPFELAEFRREVFRLLPARAR